HGRLKIARGRCAARISPNFKALAEGHILMSDGVPLGALDGVRIVDLTQMLAGPYCTMLLADQGAEIIKVEPLDGDHTRIIGPYHADDSLKSFGGYFASINRNKKSI